MSESPPSHNTTLPASLSKSVTGGKDSLTLPSDLASRPAQARMARSNVLEIAEDGHEQRFITTYLAWSAKLFSRRLKKLRGMRRLSRGQLLRGSSMEEGSARLDVQL
jgi:hypothetical protein